MTIRKTIAAAALTGALLVAGAGTAFAADGPVATPDAQGWFVAPDGTLQWNENTPNWGWGWGTGDWGTGNWGSGNWWGTAPTVPTPPTTPVFPTWPTTPTTPDWGWGGNWGQGNWGWGYWARPTTPPPGFTEDQGSWTWNENTGFWTWTVNAPAIDFDTSAQTVGAERTVTINNIARGATTAQLVVRNPDGTFTRTNANVRNGSASWTFTQDQVGNYQYWVIVPGYGQLFSGGFRSNAAPAPAPESPWPGFPGWWGGNWGWGSGGNWWGGGSWGGNWNWGPGGWMTR